MAFPRTFHDGNPEDRDFVGDFWSWLKDQPQDAWLLFARAANWDSADRIFAGMLDDPRCDRAIAAFIFWGADPGYCVRNPGRSSSGDLVRQAISRASGGAPLAAALHLDCYDVAHHVHAYIAAVREAGGRSSFTIPEQFFGPFEGRKAGIPATYDEATERELGEVLDGRLGWLPRSEEQYRESQREGGNLWLAERMSLPRVTARDATRLSAMPELERLEAIYGRHDDYRAARTPSSGKSWKSNPLVWLAAFSVLSIGGALIAHYLRTGAW